MFYRVIRMLANVFAKVRQRVIWKYDQDKLRYGEAPSNVKLLKWAPQQDLLGNYRNLRK